MSTKSRLLGLGAGTCSDLEDDFEEQSEGYEEAEGNGDLSNPGELDADAGADIPEDPDVDIDVDTDVDADVETDVETDVDVDVTLELFFEEELARGEPGVAFVSGTDASADDEEA